MTIFSGTTAMAADPALPENLGAAAEPGHSSGRFWHDRRERPPYPLPRTGETHQEREQLWAQCVRLSGWRDQRSEPIPLRSA